MKDTAVKRRKTKGCNKYAIFKVSRQTRQTTQTTQTKDNTDKNAKGNTGKNSQDSKFLSEKKFKNLWELPCMQYLQSSQVKCK